MGRRTGRAIRRRTYGLGLFAGPGAVLLVLLAACRTSPAPAEQAERAHLQSVDRVYQPGQRPPLAALTSASSLDDYLRYAMLNRPAVAAAYYDWLGAIEKIPGARTPSDPRVTFQMDIQDLITSLMPGLTVDFPGPGKLAAAGSAATSESRIKYWVFEKTVLQAAFEVKQAVYELALLDRRIELDRQALSLLNDLEKLAEARNAAGQMALPDVLKVQIERQRLQADIDNLEDSRAPLQARFKASLGLSKEQGAPPAPASLAPELSPPGHWEQLLAEALGRNPELRQMEEEIHLAEAGVTLARRAVIPDFSAGVEADVRMSPWLVRPQAGMTLPVWRERIASDLAAAQAGKQAASARLNERQIALAIEFADKRYLVREGERNLRLAQDSLLPKARLSLEAARSAYAAGSADFQSVQESRRMLLDLEIAAAEARTQRDIALAELSLLILARPPENAPLASEPSGAGKDDK